MSKKNDSTSFWISYADLMTSLFFLFLVLFVICFAKIFAPEAELKRLREELEKALIEKEQALVEKEKALVEKEQAERIVKLEEQFRGLGSSEALAYDPHSKTFIAKDFVGEEIFEPNKTDIKPEYLHRVREVGESLERVLQKLNHDKSLRFQLVIEGTAAIDWRQLRRHSYDPDNQTMYYLSYGRALALYQQWRRYGIDLRRYNTEVIIAGSGYNGINRDTEIEENNKRFVIQIIPKVSRTD